MNRKWPTSHLLLATTLAAVLSTVVGCQEATDQQSTAEPVPPPPVTFSAPPLPEVVASAVDLKVVDLAAYTEVLQGHLGEVVLVDFWATWCIPCIEHFPDAVRWSDEYAERGLAVIAMSVDDPGAAEAVAKFLAGQGAHFDTLLSEMGTGTATWDAFDIPGGVPFYKLYDRTGRLRFRFSGIADIAGTEPLEKIEARIEELLAE